MAQYSGIRIPRADITATHGYTFSNKMQNVTLPYGSPLTYASDAWYRDSSTDYNHFFVKGTYGTQPTLLYHVGPYHGNIGIDVDNNPDSVRLGQISLKLTAGTGINITDDSTTGYKTIAAVPDNPVFMCYYSTSQNTMSETYSTVLNALNNNKIVYCYASSNGSSSAEMYDVYKVECVRNAVEIVFKCNASLGAPAGIRDAIITYYADNTIHYKDYGSAHESTELWHAFLDDGTTTYTISIPESVHYGHECWLIVNNTNNTNNVTISFTDTNAPNGVKWFAKAVNANIYSVSAETVKLFKFKFGKNIDANTVSVCFIDTEDIAEYNLTPATPL